MQNLVTFTREDLEKFKAKYIEKVAVGDTVFIFKEQSFNTDYAKYVIEFLESKFNVKA